MRYWHSDLDRKRNWLESNETDPLKIIEKYYNKNCVVYDADVCGDEEVFFVFENDIMYRLSYDFWIEHDPEWEIHNEHYIEEVSLSSFKYPKDRDWIDLKMF